MRNRHLLAVAFCSSALMGTVGGCDKGPENTPSVKSPSSPDGVAVAKPAADVPVVAAAQTLPPKPQGTAYGTGVTLAATDTVSVDDILANPSAFDGKAVRVEGLVTDVCPKRGCWFELAGKEAGKKVRFKVQDGVMTFPMEAKGQHAVAQGVVTLTKLSLEESQKYAEYQAKEYGIEYDPASVTGPTTIVRIDGTGAVLD